MTKNILPNPRKLTLNTLSVPSLSQHRRSQTQLYTPHHPGSLVSSIIPCTCSDLHILSQPGTPCLVEILSPLADSLSRHSKRYGLVSPVSNSTDSLSFVSVEEEAAEYTQDVGIFQYYLPHISSKNEDHYAPWVAFDMSDANEQAETEEMVLNDFDLPFVEEDDFNYYPGRSPRPLYTADIATTEESLMLGDELVTELSVKSNKLAEKTRHWSRLREMMVKLTKRMSCKS